MNFINDIEVTERGAQASADFDNTAHPERVIVPKINCGNRPTQLHMHAKYARRAAMRDRAACSDMREQADQQRSITLGVPPRGDQCDTPELFCRSYYCTFDVL